MTELIDRLDLQDALRQKAKTFYNIEQTRGGTQDQRL